MLRKFKKYEVFFATADKVAGLSLCHLSTIMTSPMPDTVGWAYLPNNALPLSLTRRRFLEHLQKEIFQFVEIMLMQTLRLPPHPALRATLSKSGEGEIVLTSLE